MLKYKKKIIIIGPAYPLRGGLASFNERLAIELQSQENEVIIYTFSLQYPKFIFPGQTQYSTEPAPKKLNIKVCINSINPINWLSVGKKIKNEQADIIIVRYWLPLMAPALGTILRFSKSKNTKIICIADNILPHEKRFGDKPLTSYFIKPVDAFITMSKKVLNDLQNFNALKPAITLLHPLYDNFGEKISKEQARLKLNIGVDENIVLFFGFIRKYKGLDILLQSIKFLNNNPNEKKIKLLIAGEFYEDKKPYLELINELGIDDLLILHTNFIADSEVKYYLCAADVVVQPYRNATQSGVTPLAYHFEKPMIVTNVGGLPQLVPNNKVGFVAEPNAISIANKINEYFEKGEPFFLNNIIEEKKKLSWGKFTDELFLLAEKIEK